jgi:GNAT superfamily N-acetyltransferase
MNPLIRDASSEDSTAISELVRSSFSAHVAPFWEPIAQEALLAETSAERLASRIVESVIVLVHEEAGSILGVILLPRPSFVQLFFVEPGNLGKGIGRALWEAARTRIGERFPEVKTVELNASPYLISDVAQQHECRAPAASA